MNKRILRVFLSDILLIAFAGWTFFEFVLMELSPDKTIWVGEDNIIILRLEIAACVFAVVWALQRIKGGIQNMRKAHEGK